MKKRKIKTKQKTKPCSESVYQVRRAGYNSGPTLTKEDWLEQIPERFRDGRRSHLLGCSLLPGRCGR